MVSAVVSGERADLHVQITPSGTPGYVNVIVAGSPKGTKVLPIRSDEAELIVGYRRITQERIRFV